MMMKRFGVCGGKPRDLEYVDILGEFYAVVGRG